MNSNTARERVEAAAQLGANTVYVFVGSGSRTTFLNSQGIPSTDTLSATIQAAQKHGIRVYAAIPVKYFTRSGYGEQNLNGRYPGISENWLDFRNPAARKLIADLAVDIAQQYNVAGIVLDYIRYSRFWYPSSGLTPDDITSCVCETHDALAGTGVQLEASTISIYRDNTYGALDAYGQAWVDWLDRECIDRIQPMTYLDLSRLKARLAEWVATGHYPERITPILSPIRWDSDPNPKTASDWRSEIRFIRQSTDHLNVFDERHLGRHPLLADVLVKEWQP